MSMIYIPLNATRSNSSTQVATRASGMKRSIYGNIEDIVLNLRMVRGCEPAKVCVIYTLAEDLTFFGLFLF